MIGIGLVRLLDAGRRFPMVGLLAVGYLVGSVCVGLAASYLALIGVALPVAVVLLGAVGGVALLVGCGPPGVDGLLGLPRLRSPADVLEAVLVLAIVALGFTIVAAAAVGPLTETDGWAIWGLKAHALFTEGDAHGLVFDGAAYDRSHPDYPLLIPSLEALELRALGDFRGTALDVDLAVFALAAALALWSFVRAAGVHALAAAVALIALGVPVVVDTVLSNYADAQLDFLVAIAIVCLGRWLVEHDPRLLGYTTLFFGAAAMTKNEGLLFAAAALAAGAVFAERAAGGRRLLLASLGVVALIVAPWRIWLAARGVSNSDFRFRSAVDPGFLVDHLDHLHPAARRLLGELLGTWQPLTVVGALALVLAFLVGPRRVAGFALAWSTLALGGLLGAYLITRWPIDVHLHTSAARVVGPIAMSLAALAPILVTGSSREARAVIGFARGGVRRPGEGTSAGP